MVRFITRMLDDLILANNIIHYSNNSRETICNSTDAEKNILPVSIHEKTLGKRRLQGNSLNLLLSLHKNPTTFPNVMGKVCPSMGDKTKMSLSLSLFNPVELAVLDPVVRKEEEIKCIMIKKEETKLSLFTEELTLYRKPKSSQINYEI